MQNCQSQHYLYNIIISLPVFKKTLKYSISPEMPLPGEEVNEQTSPLGAASWHGTANLFVSENG